MLQVLSGSTGNLLEDEAAISIITEAKQLGTDIAEKQARRRYQMTSSLYPNPNHMRPEGQQR